MKTSPRGGLRNPRRGAGVHLGRMISLRNFRLIEYVFLSSHQRRNSSCSFTTIRNGENPRDDIHHHHFLTHQFGAMRYTNFRNLARTTYPTLPHDTTLLHMCE